MYRFASVYIHNEYDQIYQTCSRDIFGKVVSLFEIDRKKKKNFKGIRLKNILTCNYLFAKFVYLSLLATIYRDSGTTCRSVLLQFVQLYYL